MGQIWTFARMVAIGAAALAASACAQSDSEDLRTSAIHADMDVTAADGTTTLRVDLTVSDGFLGATEVDLSSGDSLRATAGGQTKTFSKDSSVIGDIEYRTSFGFDTPGTQITIALQRQNDSDAPNSTVTLPALVDITAPASGATFTTSDNLDISWSMADGSMFLDVDLECPTSIGTGYGGASTSTDDGFQSVSVAALVNSATSGGSYPLTGSCNGSITMTRTNQGSVDPAYEGGSLSATRSTSVGFIVTN